MPSIFSCGEFSFAQFCIKTIGRKAEVGIGFRFFKRMNVLPGVTLNLSKSGGSFSVGPQGARLTVGPQGARVSLGIPGSGLFYTTNF